MSNIFRLWILAVAAAALAGCSESGSDTVRDEQPEAQAMETPIADSLQKPIDRAKAVEDMAMERKAEMDKRLAEMEGEAVEGDEP